MSKLKAKSPEMAEPSKPKILIFGKPGVGKTWGALEFPKVYYIDTEGGANLAHYTERLKKSGGAYLGPEDGSSEPSIVLEQVKALATEKHEYKTLVIDSLSKLWMKMVGEFNEKWIVKHGDESDFGASKKPAIAFTRRLIIAADRLDMNVIFIAHEKDKWGKNEKDQQSIIGVTYDAWEKLEYELHLALHIQKRGASRVAVPIKSRLPGFPEGQSFAWSFADFESRFGKEVISRETKTITPATDEQVAEMLRLLEVVKVSEEILQKWFTAAKADTWSEMSSPTIQKYIDFLKTKVTGEK